MLPYDPVLPRGASHFRGGLRPRARAGRTMPPPPPAPERVRAFGRDMTPRAAFASLSFVTIASIGASCWLEELILRKLPEWRYYGTLAFFELSVFTAFTWVSARHHLGATRRVAPLRLYVVGSACMAAYATLGKVAYKYVNYATGTVLKSAKLVPVMAASVLCLGRAYHWRDYLAASLMVASAACFGLGELEAQQARDAASDGGGGSAAGSAAASNTASGFAISFLCLGLAAAQSTVADACLRDHGAGVDENMLYTNGLGAAFVLAWHGLFTSEVADASNYFGRTPGALGLVCLRSATFYFGAWTYTALVKHFGAVAAVAVTTARKALTVMASFIIFSGDKPLTPKYATAAGLFFLAVTVEVFKKRAPGTGASGRGGKEPGGGGGGGGGGTSGEARDAEEGGGGSSGEGGGEALGVVRREGRRGKEGAAPVRLR